MAGPLRAALRDTSTLIPRIQPGVQALSASARESIGAELRRDFADSLALDEALRVGNDQARRWDYLLGYNARSAVVGLEPHPAHTSEVSVVIEKRKAARAQLRTHLRDGRGVDAWFWVASGKVAFVPHEKQITRLAQEGIQFVGGQLKAKDLASLTGPAPTKRRTRARRTR